MHFAATIFPTEYAIHPAELGRAMEERGFESIWVAEHSHIPASRETPWPGGTDLPQMYYDTMDPFVWLSVAAQATTTLKVATGILLLVQRDPIHSAKSITTLDRLSNGRAIIGVGGGWNVEEMNNHGTQKEGRWKLLRERVEAMKTIWAEEQATYHGEHVSFDAIIQNPKPLQQPHPPIHVGGAPPGGLRRAIRYGNGWMPIMGRADDDVAALAKALADAATEAGRSRDELELSLFAAPGDPDFVKRAEEAGVDRLIFGLPPFGADQVLPLLDQLVSLR